MKGFLLIVIILFSIPVMAQDPQFSQFYANPVYLNPSLVGITNQYRITANHRQQWGVFNGYTTSALSFDGTAGSNSGFGLQVMSDNQMRVIKTQALYGAAAHRIQLNNDMQIGMGVGVNYYQQSYNWNNLVFEDQLDARNGQINATQERFESERISNIDFSAGMIFTTDNIVAGVSIDHIDKQNNNHMTRVLMPLKLTVHAATNLVNKNRTKKPFYFSPNIIYERQGSFEYWNLGMYYANEHWVIGSWYRVDEAIILSLGLNIKDFRVAYSYDYTIAPYGDAMRSSNEISLTYQFSISSPKKIKNQYKGKCPDFYKQML